VGVVLTIVVAVIAAGVGAYLTRRNDRAGHTDRLLAEALNDMVAAIAEVAGGAGPEAQARYASATSRIALHASPAVVAAFRAFQEDATTYTSDGRARLMEALLDGGLATRAQGPREQAGHRRRPKNLAVRIGWEARVSGTALGRGGSRFVGLVRNAI
jgi:hypothetical protein